jgi:hypothetical protein
MRCGKAAAYLTLSSLQSEEKGQLIDTTLLIQ